MMVSTNHHSKMEVTNLLTFTDRRQLRGWLAQNHLTERYCWVACNRSKTPRPDTLPYIDIVEEALCFGWIDSTLKKIPDGRLAQRLSPRRKGSHWTEFNKQRCRDLERRGLMTDFGLKVLQESYEKKYGNKETDSSRKETGQ